MDPPSASVIVPAHNASGTLPATLDALAGQRSERPFEVIVVDDGSSDGTAAIARAAPVVSEVLTLDGVGPGRARNAGAAAAGGTMLAFLDADTRPVEGWLAAGLRGLAAADLVVGRVVPEPDVPLGPFDRTLWVTGVSPLFESANLFVRRELFEALGGFESWLGPRAGKELGEDVWLGWRARRAGARIAASGDALAYHAVFPRGPVGFAAERWRLRFFPALAARVPELRRELFYGRVFLTRRSAAFDAAVLGLGLAMLTRTRPPLLAALPYAAMLRGDAREGRGRLGGRPRGVPGAITLSAGRAAADAVGAAALTLGSVTARSPLL
jgi:glycosyltransferase involved in cell wall biosynthesis